jgi:hypothetical protein
MAQYNRAEPITSIIPSRMSSPQSIRAVQHDTTTLFLGIFPPHWFIAKYDE